MAYSRWSNSRWYTYWDAASGETKEKQLFTICGEDMSFTYEELSQDMDGYLSIVKKMVPNATEEDLQELKTYMKEFMQDVEDK